MTDEMFHDQFASKALECKLNKEFKSKVCLDIAYLLKTENLLLKTL